MIVGGMHQRNFAESLRLLIHQDLFLYFHTPAELNPYQRMREIGYNTLTELS